MTYLEREGAPSLPRRRAARARRHRRGDRVPPVLDRPGVDGAGDPTVASWTCRSNTCEQYEAPDVASRNEAILVHLRHMQQQLERTDDGRLVAGVARGRSTHVHRDSPIHRTDVNAPDHRHGRVRRHRRVVGLRSTSSTAASSAPGSAYSARTVRCDFSEFFELGLGKVTCVRAGHRRHGYDRPGRAARPSGHRFRGDGPRGAVRRSSTAHSCARHPCQAPAHRDRRADP